MKNFAILIIGIFMTMPLCAQEMSDTQWSMLSKRTADWCPHCGAWGWDFFEDAIDRMKDENLIIWAVHHSGGLSNATTQELINNYPATGQPVFYLGEDNLGVTSNNGAEKLNELADFVPAINSFEPSEIAGSEVKVVGNEVVIKKKVGFKTDRTISNNLFLATYIVQDDLVAYQSNQGNDAHHKNVVLGTVSGNAFGEAIPNGSYSNGDEYAYDEKRINVADWNFPTSDVSIVTVVWTLDNGRYYFINANKQPMSASPSSTIDINDAKDLNIVSITSDRIALEWSGKTIADATIQLSDQQGRVISQSTADVETGSTVYLERKSSVSGIYYVTLMDGKGVVTKKVFMN